MQNKRKLKDHEIIQNFVNIVDIPAGLTSTSSGFFYSIIQKLNMYARRFI